MSTQFTEQDAARLAQAEAAFEEAGGRGVDLAEEIDALRLKRDNKYTAAQVMAALPDPDMVGTNAYRSVHEAIEAAVESTFPEDDVLDTAVVEATEVGAAAFEAYRALKGLLGPDPTDEARKLVNNYVREVLVEVMGDKPYTTTMRDVVQAVSGGRVTVATDGDSEDEIHALQSLLAIRDLVPGGYYVQNLLDNPTHPNNEF